RPATRWRDWVSSPGASPWWAARTSEISSRSPKPCGNGSTPASLRRSSFSRRSLRTSDSSGFSGSLMKSRAYPGSGRLNFRDFEFFLRAARDFDRDHVIALAADQGFADRRLIREFVLERVGLGRADDLKFLRVAGFLVFDVDDRADGDLVGANVFFVDDRGATQALFKPGDPPLEQ